MPLYVEGAKYHTQNVNRHYFLSRLLKPKACVECGLRKECFVMSIIKSLQQRRSYDQIAKGLPVAENISLRVSVIR